MNSLETGGAASEAVANACHGNSSSASAAHVFEHPVLLLDRYDETNVYHFMEDVAAVFMSLAVLDSPIVKHLGVQVGAFVYWNIKHVPPRDSLCIFPDPSKGSY